MCQQGHKSDKWFGTSRKCVPGNVYETIFVAFLIICAVLSSAYWVFKYFKQENERLILESADIIGNVAELEIKQTNKTSMMTSEQVTTGPGTKQSGGDTDRTDEMSDTVAESGLMVSVNDETIVFEYPLPEERTTDKFLMNESMEVPPDKAYDYEVHEEPTL